MHSKEIKYYSLREEKRGGGLQTTQQNISQYINNGYKKGKLPKAGQYRTATRKAP